LFTVASFPLFIAIFIQQAAFRKVVAALVKRYAVLLFHNRAKTSAAIFRNYGKEFITLLHADFTFRKFGEEL
jgi:hypothetical protein